MRLTICSNNTTFTQGLPCTIGHIEANPLLKGDNTRGVLLGEFPLKYEAFDNSVASGIENLK